MSGSSSPPSGDAGGALVLSPLDVSLAAALIVVQALVSLRYKLGLHTQLLIAAVRCILQLSVLGYVLGELCLSCLVALTCDALCRLPAAADLRVLAFNGAAPLTLLNTLKHPHPHQVPIFEYNRAWLVLAYGGFMVGVSAFEAVGRPAMTFKVRPFWQLVVIRAL